MTRARAQSRRRNRNVSIRRSAIGDDVRRMMSDVLWVLSPRDRWARYVVVVVVASVCACLCAQSLIVSDRSLDGWPDWLKSAHARACPLSMRVNTGVCLKASLVKVPKWSYKRLPAETLVPGAGGASVMCVFSKFKYTHTHAQYSTTVAVLVYC